MKRTTPQKIPLAPGDRVIFRKAGQAATIEVMPNSRSPDTISHYEIESRRFDTFHDAILHLITHGFSGATIRTERIYNNQNQNTNNNAN